MDLKSFFQPGLSRRWLIVQTFQPRCGSTPDGPIGRIRFVLLINWVTNDLIKKISVQL